MKRSCNKSTAKKNHTHNTQLNISNFYSSQTLIRHLVSKLSRDISFDEDGHAHTFGHDFFLRGIYTGETLFL